MLEEDKLFVKLAGYSGLILMFCWCVCIVYWFGFTTREDLYGASLSISIVFGYFMMAVTTAGMWLVFYVIGRLEDTIKRLESQLFQN